MLFISLNFADGLHEEEGSVEKPALAMKQLPAKIEKPGCHTHSECLGARLYV